MNKRDDLFIIQIKLFRLAQLKWNKTTKAFLKFIKSQIGQMLFDESTDMWMNGPDYIADEYRREMAVK